MPPFSGRSGKKLATWAGVEDLHEHFETRNIYDHWTGTWQKGKGDYWNAKDAFEVADRMLPDLAGRTVVCVGQRVARAFGLRKLAMFESIERFGGTWYVIPHPSGLNKVYNDAALVEEAGRVLRAALKDCREAEYSLSGVHE